jgi:hypothetical protein
MKKQSFLMKILNTDGFWLACLLFSSCLITLFLIISVFFGFSIQTFWCAIAGTFFSMIVLLSILEYLLTAERTLNLVEIWRSNFWYAVKVEVSGFDEGKIEKWLNENLTGYFDRPTILTYRFSRKSMAVMFKLRWS